MVIHTERETYISLYAGGGGLDLGFQLANPRAVPILYVEREIHAATLLVDHIQAGILDAAPVWSDSGTLDCEPFIDRVDWIIGGFPCQPWSQAGSRKGTDDERWLWPHIARMVREIRPNRLFLENVPGLLSGGIEYVLGDLAEMGFDSEWGSVKASDVGAPHRRERTFILAYRHGWRSEGWGVPVRSRESREATSHAHRRSPKLADSDSGFSDRPGEQLRTGRDSADHSCEELADSAGIVGTRGKREGTAGRQPEAAIGNGSGDLDNPTSKQNDRGKARNVGKAKSKRRRIDAPITDASGAMADPSSTRPQGGDDNGQPPGGVQHVPAERSGELADPDNSGNSSSRSRTDGNGPQKNERRSVESQPEPGRPGNKLADTTRDGGNGRKRKSRWVGRGRVREGGDDLGYPGHDAGSTGNGEQQDGQVEAARVGQSGESVGDPDGSGLRQSDPQNEGRSPEQPVSGSGELADTGSTGREGQLFGRCDGEEGWEIEDGCPAAGNGTVAHAFSERRCSRNPGWQYAARPFPPGPDASAEWRSILEVSPELAPAIEPSVRGVVDGMAPELGKASVLRILGNGVVPQQAAYAYRLLVERVLAR